MGQGRKSAQLPQGLARDPSGLVDDVVVCSNAKH